MTITAKSSCSAIALMCVAANAQAVDIYKDDKNLATLTGHYQVQYVSSDSSNEIVDSNSRIAFGFNKHIPKEWTAVGYLELGVELAENNNSLVVQGNGIKGSSSKDDSVWLRQGYVGAKHEDYGSITIGKQWGSIYTVSGQADIWHYLGGDAAGIYNLGSDGGFSGTGRAEQAIQYNNKFGDLALSLQYQATEEDISVYNQFGEEIDGVSALYDDSFGFGLKYSLPWNITLGAGYNEAYLEFEDSNANQTFDVDDTLTAFSISYGSGKSDKVYVVAIFTEAEFHEINDQNGLMEESTGLEVWASYRFMDDKFMSYGGYNALEDDSSGEDNSYKRSHYLLGLAYYYDPSFYVFTEAQLEDDSKFADGSTNDRDDIFALGIRYQF
ncbi:porin [Catenovulum sp. SM1970]|uniref:porin n=1 Tax=Marinifaba aquimaris TaxID=2741323 RepID=UPI0015728617|nr:porin [Marinifaba aquimaris]NTS78346.1 porin [Marinifaba aquimaris]